jgi:hypothetical protein
MKEEIAETANIIDVSQFGADVSTILSLVVVLVLGVIGFFQTRKKSRIQYTLGLMQFKFEQDDIFRAYDYVSELIVEGKPYVRSDDDVQLGQDVEKLLSYFELIAIAYLRKDADRKIIEEQIKSGMCKTYEICEEYIIDRRKALGRPKLYDNLKRFKDLFS